MKKLLSLILLVFILIGCNSKQRPQEDTVSGTPVNLSHAKGFSITHAKDYSIVTVYNPWKKGETYDKYYLVKREECVTPSDGHKVVIPLKSLMTNSATHLGFLELLGELDKVKGVCNAQYIYNPTILKGVKEGRIKDLGDAFNLDIENLLLLHPQAVMTSAYNAEDENSRRMKQTGLPILYNIEWQEPSILGRAEWIKYIATFFDKGAMADSIFTSVERKYSELQTLARTASNAPTIFSGQDYRGTWSMPGGQSYSAQLFNHAGAHYYYAEDTTSASIPTTIEEALLHFSKEDIWIGVQANSLEELEKTDSKYRLFKAYQTGNVYNTNKRMNNAGGNDYWESGVARPELLLSDLIKICHPELLSDYELIFFEQLK